MNSLQIRWRHLLALSLILLCSVSALFARPLSEREARHLAEQFFHQVAYAHKVLAPAQQPLSLVSAPIRQSAGVELRTLSGDKARYYYIYNRGSNAGFVIIAGDDELTPYIGYATTGQVLEQDMPEQLRAFLKACQERIDELTSSVGLRSSLRPTPRTATEPAQIAPLLGNIQWNQSAPWNNQTPTDNQGKHMPVGCVATAYTQVMRYHQWPTQGEGTFSYTEERSNRQHSVDYGATTYDWAHMPERYNDPSSATSEETQALSTLAYHAGVAVEMMYAPSGSGSYTPLVARALADHFRYDKRVSFKSRSNYTQSSWEQMLRAELIAARPIVYSGSGSGGGHAFVCDGYDAEGLFHINWGWGGMSDGYFNLNYLVPSDLGIGGGAGGGFSLGQGAVIGIKPDRTGTSQRTVSSVVTTWRFGMTFTEGTLDASAEYTVVLTTDATPYDGSVTYGVTKVGTTDTLYLDQYARNARIDGLYQGFSIDPEKLQLSNHIGVGTWDIFLAYRHTDAKGQTAWRPCGQHERAKEQYRHTYTITQESDGSYVVTEEASSNLSMLELVAGSVQSSIVGYEKSKVSLQLRNTGRVEFFNQLYLYARKVGERIFEPVVNILPAIDAGVVKEVTFDIDRFPYGSGDVELEVGYFAKNDFTPIWSNTVSIQSATDIRPAYVLSSDQPVTVNVNSGNLSQIRIRNIGTKTPTNRVFYRWELRKEKQTASTRWTQIDIPAGGEQLVAPNLADELSQIDAKRGDNITLTATFVEVSGEGRIISVIPLMEEPKLSVYCDGELVVGDGVITMTTAKPVGESIKLYYEADGDVSIEGANGTPRPSDFVDYKLNNQQVTLRGDITALYCMENRLTDIDVSQCRSLRVLLCLLNEIKGESMLQLVNSLPDRTGLENGLFVVYSDGSYGSDGNVCLNSDVAIARAKNWEVALATVENGKLKLYRYDGEDPTKTFAVTLTKKGEGTLTATGADDLNAVPYGTELTIEATPAEGYELFALTANGKDILATKKLSVREDTEIKATFAKVDDGVITMTTSRAVGEQIMLAMSPVEGQTVIAEGLKEPLILDGTEHLYTLTSQTVTLRGNLILLQCDGAVDMETPPSHENQLTSLDINCETLTLLSCSGNPLTSLDLSHARALTALACYENKLTQLDLSPCTKLTELGVGENLLTHLDVSHNRELQFLDCYGNQIKGEAMTALVNGLPDRRGKVSGIFQVIGNNAKTDGNICLKSDVAIAKGKNWSVQSFSGDYEGEDPTYSVTLTKEGEGTLTVTGADDLDAVPYDTELTVIATPAEGYELTALTANGTDILATKKFVVKDNVTVKATFAKKTFAVKLTKEGEGTLVATGADDLNAVPYGTELTINATPATGYELTALTANGTDILATKKFVVKGATEVKATFAKKSFAVSLTKEGEGTLTATGADNLTAVPYGTELTIAATPAEGYELTALTANGTDILATKKFVVKGATEVKATFEKKTFAVTLTSNEHGTISIVENVDLKAVPYGTTLTVQATGKNDQCELTALTANGEDILATKKFVVKGATEVKATFVDHTGVETTVTQQVKLYPNPATDYVIVEGIAPASEVMLHSMTGELLCAMQADAEGHLQIDLTALSDGVYLLVGTGWQERLVVKK